MECDLSDTFDLNPFTGEFDRIGKNNGSGGSSGTTVSFVLSDWVLVGGVYRLDLQHNLETLNVLAEFFENSNIQVFADRFEVLNTNTIRIYTTMDPDCRFEGKAVVVPV